MIEISDAERLARAVLLFHRGGVWSGDDRALWRHYTGVDEATTRVLCDLARRVRSREEADQRAILHLDQQPTLPGDPGSPGRSGG